MMVVMFVMMVYVQVCAIQLWTSTDGFLTVGSICSKYNADSCFCSETSKVKEIYVIPASISL